MKKRKLLVALAAFGMAVALTLPAFATVSTDAGFEFADGNLAPQAPINFDWNSFAPTTWTGTAPGRTATKTVLGWAFTGLEDAQATTSDSGFAGGTKQDDDCAKVITAKAPNKDDLKRVYVTSNTVGGDVFLGLAWVRIPQNTTSPSAHIGFEFNQGTTACPAGSDGLVRRTAGDMLIVYDFEGGATDTPSITLRRWLTDPDDPDQADFFTDPNSPCDVDSDSPPCWGDAVNLSALGFAEARVNTSAVGTVTDTIQPPTATNPLGLNEFGEAGINLTDAGVFGSDECTAFGKTYAVSRSSGNSGTAQMKDLVGPDDINITNCGAVIIRKVTVPSPDPTDTTFTYTTAGGLDPETFGLKDGENQDYGSEVFAGSYSVTEDDPPANFEFTSVDCSASDVTHGTTIDTSSAPTVSFDLKALDTVDCTYTNTLKTGAILVTKTRKQAADGPGDHPHAGVDFTVNGVTKATDANGKACFDGLTFGTYTVHETVPAGYHVDANDKQVTVDNTATCGDNPYVGETVSFHNTPLTDLSVSVDSQVPGGTSSTIDCGSAGSAGPGDDVTLNADDLEPGTITCTIVIDP